MTEPHSIADQSAAPLSEPMRLFSVFFLDPAAASARLVELTDYAVTQRDSGWARRAAISRAISLVVPRATEVIAAQCAQTLTMHHAMDQLITEAFLARRDESARIVLSESTGISHRLTLQVAAIGSEDEARALTGRTDLEDTVVQILLNRRDRPIDILLAENHGLPLTRLALDRMLTRALIDPALSRSLFDRPDLSLEDRAGLFLHAAHAQRMSVITELRGTHDIGETDNPVPVTGFDEASPSGGAFTPQHELLTMLDTHLQAHDHAGFVNTAARALNIETLRLSICLIETSGVALILLATLFGASDGFIERMQKVWSRPMPHEARKRHDLDEMRRVLTPVIAGSILEHILSIDIAEHRERSDPDQMRIDRVVVAK